MALNIDVGKIKFTWKGAYDAATTYERDDVVSHDGDSWICVIGPDTFGNAQTVTGIAPSTSATTQWNKMAQGSNLGNITGISAGDMFYYDGTDFQRLPIGTSGQNIIVGSDGVTPEWTGTSGSAFGVTSQGQRLIQRYVRTWTGGTHTMNAGSWTWVLGLYDDFTPVSSTSRIEMRGDFTWGAGWDGGNGNAIGWGYPGISDTDGTTNLDWFSDTNHYFSFESHTGGTANQGGRPGTFAAIRDSWGAGVTKRIGLLANCYDNTNYRIRFHRTNWNAPGSGSDLNCRATFYVEEWDT